MSNLPLITIVLAMCTFCEVDLAAMPKKPKVILVSMDGFRHDYFTMTDTPNFDRMRMEGVSMPWINNTFTTLTFPSHFTMVTGLYEESHGIVGNRMYDPTMKRKYFGFSTTDSEWWTGHETIWTTIQKQTKKAGVYFWPGSSSIIQSTLPEKYFSYSGSVDFETRVDTLVQWMTEEDFDLGLIYFDEPDHTGHAYGPTGNETMAQVRRMDGILGRLMDGLEAAGMKDDINVIVTSDHGMTDVDSYTLLIDLEEHVDMSLIDKVVTTGPIAEILPMEGKAREVVESLKDVAHVTAYLKEDIPEEFHFKHHPRIQPVLLVAEEGWMITKNITYQKSSFRFRGNHGYDNSLLSMKPIFVARGPAFKSNVVAPTMETVDIYPLICHLLDIAPAPNNGSLERAAALLLVDPSTAHDDSPECSCARDASAMITVCDSLVVVLLLGVKCLNSLIFP